MKKLLLVFLVLILGFSLSGCFKKTDLTKEEASTEMPAATEDDSLQMIEEELDDTELEEFEAELDGLDEEINQL